MKNTVFSVDHYVLFGLILITAVLTYSCQKDEFERNMQEDVTLTPMGAFQVAEPVICYGPEIFTTISKDPVNVTRIISEPDFGYLENFTIKVQNGNSGNTRVNKLEILVNGVTVISHPDFKRNNNLVTKQLSGFLQESQLTVKIDGPRGRFVIVTIEAYLKPDVISDVDGNYYKTVEICGRWWMAENLRATKFNDGTPIDNVTGNSDWIDHALNMVSGYCWYNNDPVSKDVYGALYNWTAVKSHYVNKQVCPAGWHVPDSHYDLMEMLLCLDPDSHETMGIMSEIAGGFLKEEGTDHWISPNTGATNSTGFTAVPGGMRYHDGSFTSLRQLGAYWTDDGLARFFIGCSSTDVSFSEGGNEYGYSVRCIKDNP